MIYCLSLFPIKLQTLKMEWTKTTPIFYFGVTWIKLIGHNDENDDKSSDSKINDSKTTLQISDKDIEEVIHVTNHPAGDDHISDREVDESRKYFIVGIESSIKHTYCINIEYKDLNSIQCYTERLENNDTLTFKFKKSTESKGTYGKLLVSVCNVDYYENNGHETVFYKNTQFPDAYLTILGSEADDLIPIHKVILAHHSLYFKSLFLPDKSLYNKSNLNLSSTVIDTNSTRLTERSSDSGTSKSDQVITSGNLNITSSSNNNFYESIKSGTCDKPIKSSTSDAPIKSSMCDKPIKSGTSDGPVESGTSDGPTLSENMKNNIYTIDVNPPLLTDAKSIALLTLSTQEKKRVVLCFIEIMYAGYSDLDDEEKYKQKSFEMFLNLSDDEICGLIEISNKYLCHKISKAIFWMINDSISNMEDKNCKETGRVFNIFKLLQTIKIVDI